MVGAAQHKEPRFVATAINSKSEPRRPFFGRRRTITP